MAIDAKSAERQKRYRQREKIRAQATFANAIEIEIAWFGINAEGQHVAIGYDGKSIPLIVATPATQVEPVPTTIHASVKPRTVYAPKSWNPAIWNDNVRQIREGSMTKDDVISFLSDAAQEKNTPDAHKRAKQAIAVIQALPDVPDWYDHLPLAQVS